MIRKLGVVALAVSALSVMGCSATKQVSSQASDSETGQMNMVLAKISESTSLAVNAQRELALTADAKVAREALMRQRLLTDVVDYDFFGDVEDILREIATKYAYDFEIYGKRPPERMNVNVFVKKRPVVEVLKQIGYQATSTMDIKVTKTAIELHYKQRAER